MSSAAPHVFVIMPIYNAAPYLAETAETILAQTFGDFEFMIHNDSSTDNSLAMLQDHAARRPVVSMFAGALSSLVT